MRDHVHALGRDAELGGQARAAVLGVHDDRVEALVQAPLPAQLPWAWLAREHVVRGDHERPAARQQRRVELLHGEPLEVDEVRRARGAPVAEHVGHVLGELHGAPRAGRVQAGGGAVEVLAPHVAVGRGDRPVGEAAGEQLDLGAGAGERAGERVVVRRREGRRVYDVNAHGDGE